MKRRMIIVTRGLDMGGVEVGLINFLNIIDKNKYDVTVVIVHKHGSLKDNYPHDVKYVTVKFDSVEYLKLIGEDLTLDFLGKCKYKCIYDAMRKFYINTENPRLYSALKHCKKIEGMYDVAIDYHGYASFTTVFMCEKINASKYITFVHNEDMKYMEDMRWMSKKIDDIYCVSKACKYNMEEKFPELKEKLGVFYNVVNEKDIKEKALLPQDDILENKKNVLLTIGRLRTQKGYEYLLEAASELNKIGMDFHWYIIGKGPLRNKIMKLIKYYHLEQRVILLGEKINPYPYIKRCDVYVQTSRHEGFCLAICEAKILNKPIVSTDLPCIREQIQHGINGLLCGKTGIEIAESIYKISNEEQMRNNFVKELEKFVINTEEQIQILNSL